MASESSPKQISVYLNVGDTCSDIVYMTETELWETAQFLKRLQFDMARQVATSKENAYQMIDGLAKIERLLNTAGYAPR